MATHDSDDEQTRIWNGSAGNAWVDSQQLIEQVFRPIEDLLIDAVIARRPVPRVVLDVG